jgi:hypothetical protein
VRIREDFPGRWRRYAARVVQSTDDDSRTGLIAAADVVDVFVYVVVPNRVAR